MNSALSVLVGLLLATNQLSAATNLVVRATGYNLAIPDPNDPLEKEFHKLLEEDEAADKEADAWIKQEAEFESKGASVSKAALSLKVEQRFEQVEKAYEAFLEKHPDHARAHLAFGSFLMDIRKEEEGVKQMEKAKELDPLNPAAWNNLANSYGHGGPVKKAFEYYAKAIELNPKEPVYLQNLATTTYLFRKDAMEYYKLTEPEVFDRALDLYRKALALDPKNFALATDLAQSYYGIRPLRAKDAVDAWQTALTLATNEAERQGTYLHLARVELNSGQFEEARKHLDLVSMEDMKTLKTRLERNLAEKQKAAKPEEKP